MRVVSEIIGGPGSRSPGQGSTSQTESGVHQVCPETPFSTEMRMLSFLSRYVTDEFDQDCKGIWSDGLITNPLCNE